MFAHACTRTQHRWPRPALIRRDGYNWVLWSYVRLLRKPQWAGPGEMELDGEGMDGAVGGVGGCCRRCCCCTITKRIRTAPNPSPIAQACTPTAKAKHDGFLEQHVLSPQPTSSSVHITAHGCTWPVATVLWTAPHLHKEPTRLQAHHPPLPLSIYLSSLFPQESRSRQWHIRQGFTSAARIDKLLLPSRPDLSLSHNNIATCCTPTKASLFCFSPPALSHPNWLLTDLLWWGGEKMEEGSWGEKEPLYLLLPWLYNYAESMWRCEFLRLQRSQQLLHSRKHNFIY